MTVRLIGAALLLLSAAVLGKTLSDNMKKRCEDLAETIQKLEKAEELIVNLMTPLPKVYEMLSSGSRVGVFFGKLAAASERDTEKLWRESLAETYLEEEEKNELIRFSVTLGNGNAEHHKRNIERLLKQFEDILGKAKKRYEQEGMLYRKLGIYAAGLIIILLM